MNNFILGIILISPLLSLLSSLVFTNGSDKDIVLGVVFFEMFYLFGLGLGLVIGALRWL